MATPQTASPPADGQRGFLAETGAEILQAVRLYFAPVRAVWADSVKYVTEQSDGGTPPRGGS